MTRSGRITTIGVALAIVVTLAVTESAAVSAPAAKQVHGKGRLLSPVLVFVDPAKGDKKSARAFYQAYFRTAAGFAGPGHAAGTMQVDEALSAESEDLASLGGGRPTGRCYLWTVTTTRELTPKLTKKRVGDTVTVRFHAYQTGLQVRKVRLRAWPSRHPETSDPALKRAVRKIGCRA